MKHIVPYNSFFFYNIHLTCLSTFASHRCVMVNVCVLVIWCWLIVLSIYLFVFSLLTDFFYLKNQVYNIILTSEPLFWIFWNLTLILFCSPIFFNIMEFYSKICLIGNHNTYFVNESTVLLKNTRTKPEILQF